MSFIIVGRKRTDSTIPAINADYRKLRRKKRKRKVKARKVPLTTSEIARRKAKGLPCE